MARAVPQRGAARRVLGDVHRGVSHGRDGGAPAAGVRAVVWERSLGQLVAVGLTVLALTAGRAFALVGVTVIAGVAVVAALVLLLRVVPERWRAVLLDDLRRLWVGRRLVPVVVTSTLAALGHAAVFLLAVRLTSPELPLLPLLPVALLVLVAAALPVNLAGWGPREGAAAWAFAAAGLPAAAGLEASVAFGVLSLVATWPGAVLLLAGRRTPATRGSASVPPIPSSPEEMSRA
ncbi:lysylphosphatidylglycerol synthase domain-containing protein [Nocardioides sp.]|uniref:lysylphosphatidylglycerol synthase domain-containing protein n=1 Tax=Nocardioides sp. TaxID=35761 RepID=UPI003527F187